jgi:hypothetical protein
VNIKDLAETYRIIIIVSSGNRLGKEYHSGKAIFLTLIHNAPTPAYRTGRFGTLKITPQVSLSLKIRGVKGEL